MIDSSSYIQFCQKPVYFLIVISCSIFSSQGCMLACASHDQAEADDRYQRITKYKEKMNEKIKIFFRI